MATRRITTSPRLIAVVIAALLIPYLYLYAQYLARNLRWMPLGDDYAFHVYSALVERGNPLAILTSPSEYPGIPHLLGLLTGNPLALARAYAVYGVVLLALGVLLYGLFFRALGAGKAEALAVSAAVVLGSVRTLAGILDGQLPDKTVLLVWVPISLYLYVRGRRIAAEAVAGLSLFTNYLGVAYAGVLAAAEAAFGGRKARIFFAALVAAGAALLWYKFATVFGLASQAEASPGYSWNPLWGLIYGFYGPSALLLIPLAVYYLPKTEKARPLIVTALVVLAAAMLSQAYGERLMRIASLLVPAGVAAGALELGRRRELAVALAVYLAGPAAAGWAWATGHLPGLFAPVDRITPQKLSAYMAILSRLPRNSTVEVMWSLDLWMLPLAKAYRPDLNVTVVACNWTKAPYYVYTPPSPDQWYLPCIARAPPPPGVLIADYNGTGLYAGRGPPP